MQNFLRCLIQQLFFLYQLMQQDGPNEQEACEGSILNLQPCAKEDNYPAWMKEFLTKEKQFQQNLAQVKNDIQHVEKGLKEFDDKEKAYTKHIKQSMAAKQALGAQDYQANYQRRKEEHNSKMSSCNIPVLAFLGIVLFFPNPIKAVLRLRRVCRRWYAVSQSSVVWHHLLHKMLGEQMELCISAEDYQSSLIYLMKEFQDCSITLKSSNSSYLTNSQVQKCIKALKFIQQVASIPWANRTQRMVFEYCSSIDFKSSLDQLLESQNFMVKHEVENCFVTLQKVCNYKFKRLKNLDPLLQLKKWLNEEQDELSFDSRTYYRLISEDNKINIKIRDLKTDYDKLRTLKLIQQQAHLTYYSGSKIIEAIISFTLKNNSLQGQGMFDSTLVRFHGILELRNPSKTVFTSYDYGVPDLGSGNLTFIQEGQEADQQFFKSQKFQIHVLQDRNGFFYIVGLSGSADLIFRFI